MIPSPSQSVDAHSQQNMSETHVTSNNLGLLNLPEVAEMLRVSRITVYRLVAKRILSVYRVGRRMRFRKDHILGYLEQNHYGGSKD